MCKRPDMGASRKIGKASVEASRRVESEHGGIQKVVARKRRDMPETEWASKREK